MKDRSLRAGGFTLIELLIVLAIIGIVAATAMAGYRGARVNGNEAVTIAGLSAINQAQFAFAQQCGNSRYAPTLVALGAPLPSTGQPFLSPDLVMSDPLSKSGYQITMGGTPVTDTGLTCTGVSPVTTYQITADPLHPGLSGIRFFGSNTDQVIYEDTATFTGNMPEKGAPGHGQELKVIK